ncbi:MAG: precorrin-6y C5,15-methyltransferase (decarboxylating) subunit CbiE [Deltaproteobacteria bacterium]|jgi:precorrin-6Y C5,15-methyltransferase (decarboxylating)|nr:precorrin-6y C5,15-methyltransferase (decarboxylating) subunit CbiE [Deltaproteobacteria bacterium]
MTAGTGKKQGRNAARDGAPGRVTVLGLADTSDLTAPTRTLIGEARIVAGPRRLLESVAGVMSGEAASIPLSGSLTRWLGDLAKAAATGEPVLVLADGDPNYFGLGARVKAALPGRHIVLRPAVTTVQKAFALLGSTWAGAEVQSLHGRKDWKPFWAAVFRAGQAGGTGKVAVYTDKENSPRCIASRMLERGQTNWDVHVFEDLGTERQSVWMGSLAPAAEMDFSELNLTVLSQTSAPSFLTLGSPEDAFEHTAGMITKSEVRVTALGLLELRGSETLWDLGCGSGSLSLEAGLLLPHGRICAVELDRQRAAQARNNRAKFGVAHLDILEGDALDLLPGLPKPDRVFVGGGGPRLEAILREALGLVSPGGVVVVAVVRLDSLDSAINAMTAAGIQPSVTQILAARGEPLSGSLYLKPTNPVFLVKARVPGKKGAKAPAKA